MPTLTLTHESPAALLMPAIDLDLEMVRQKLADPEEGKGWSRAVLDGADLEYRKFLALCLAYPDEAIVPCKLVDDFWHQHILDTRAYREDCDRVFGFFYDHFPYFGMRDADDAAALKDAYDRTLELYELNFGAPPPATWKTLEGAKCRTGCKPVKCK